MIPILTFHPNLCFWNRILLYKEKMGIMQGQNTKDLAGTARNGKEIAGKEEELNGSS